MGKKTEKIHDILEGLNSFASSHTIKRYGKTYRLISHAQLKALVSDFVGYKSMPDRHTLNLWINDLVLNGFLESNNFKSYEKREYKIISYSILLWLTNYNKEQLTIFNKLTKTQKPTTLPKSKQVMLEYYKESRTPLIKKTNGLTVSTQIL